MTEDYAESKTFDPFEKLREMRDAYLDATSKTMIDAVNSEAYAQASGAMLENYLTASAPFRAALEKSMIQALEQLSLPSRQEVAVLAERFTNVEMRLDDIDARLDEIVILCKSLQTLANEQPPVTATPKLKTTSAARVPASTKRPPSAAKPPRKRAVRKGRR
jgi:predicted dinucleotide-binding enzyme